MKRSVTVFLVTIGLLLGIASGAAYAHNCPETPWSVYTEGEAVGGACLASGLDTNLSVYNCTSPGSSVLFCDDERASDGTPRIRTCTKTCIGSSGGGTGGGLTQEQLDAIAAVLAALQNAQGYSSSASEKLSSLNTLYAGLAQLQSSFADYRGQVSGALSTIGGALSRVSNYLQQGEALGPQALAMIEQQVAIGVARRALADEINKGTQGCSTGDPVLVASGFESYSTEDLSYKGLHNLITISRQFRSNSTDLTSSFGRSWFFNYDTNVVAGRKPLIKEREILTADLETEAGRLAGLAAAAMNEAMSALKTARDAAAQAQSVANRIAGVNSQIGSLSSEISALNGSAASAAATASQQAAIAGTSDAQTNAASAQSSADTTAGYASQASSTATSAATAANNAAQSAAAAGNDLDQAETSVAAIVQKENSIKTILAERIADAAEAAAEARLEEETYPLDPYPADPTVYFGPGYVKLFTEAGTPILFKEQEGDDGHYLPVTDNGSYTDEILAIETGFMLVDTNRNSREFLHNGKGIYLFSRAVDTNNNITQFMRTGDKLTEIIDPVGRRTTIGYNAEGYISLITDPRGTRTATAMKKEN